MGAGKRIASLPHINIQRVVSSDLDRAVETAQLIIKQLPYPVELELDPAFRERSCGEFEGRRTQDVMQQYPGNLCKKTRLNLVDYAR